MGYAIGVMSGTSLDGIDVALVEISGVDEETQVALKGFKTVAINQPLKEKIREQLNPKTSSVDVLCSLNVELSEAFADACLQLCEEVGLASSELDFVASHGQTLYHQPIASEKLVASTLQLGEPAVLAERLQTTVVSNFRPRDMVVGGQGAPLVPYSEYLLYRTREKMTLLQNIGGIGNVTLLPQNTTLEDMLAFDTGPGNMLIDALCQHFYQEPFDKDGHYAEKGELNQMLLADLTSHSYLQKPFPKSTGREEFGQQYADRLLACYPDIPANDFIATATYFTAYCIAYHVQPLTQGHPARLIVGGGGSYNATMMQFIKDLLPEVEVLQQEDIGFSSEAKEAIAFAILGNQTLHHRPSNVPSATGARKSVILGSITYYD